MKSVGWIEKAAKKDRQKGTQAKPRFKPKPSPGTHKEKSSWEGRLGTNLAKQAVGDTKKEQLVDVAS